MMTYIFRAKKGPQEIIEGTIEADSEKEAIEKVAAMGYLPVRIEEKSSALGSAGALAVEVPIVRIRSREITVFSRELASLLKAGVPILRAINVILEQTPDQKLKMVLKDLHAKLKDGSTFSSALSRYPKVFSPFYLALVRAGEDSGTISEVLLRIADYRLKQEELLSRFRMALAYPILMALVGLGTIVFMLTFVMPRLMRIFMNMGQDLPLPTRILISASNFLRQWWVWVTLLLFILVARRQSKTETAKLFLSRVVLSLPIFGNLVLKSELNRFCRTLELLLKSGIGLLRAIAVALPVVGNRIIKEQLQRSSQELEKGGSFGRSLKNSRLLPVFMTNLIIIGEESGKLTGALEEIASSYERDTEEAIKIMTNLLEPLMILGMGLIVGFIVVAMLLPIFEINVMAR